MKMINQEESKVDQVLFSSKSSVAYDSESEYTFKRSNCGGRRRRKARQRDDDDCLSGLRSKYILEGIFQELYDLQLENAKLRKMVVDNIASPHLAELILRDCESPPVDIFLPTCVMEDDEEEDLLGFEDDPICTNNPTSNISRHNDNQAKPKISFVKNDNDSLSIKRSPQSDRCSRLLGLNRAEEKDEFLMEAFQHGYAF